MMTIDQAYAKINGMAWNLSGVNGTLRIETINGMTEIVHHATAGGRRSKAYRTIREQLGDDYVTQLEIGEETQKIFAAIE